MDKKDYVKITYESKPIGEYGIILRLTTFDIEAWKRDQKLKEIPTKQIVKEFIAPQMHEPHSMVEAVTQSNNMLLVRAQIEKFIRDTYDQQLQEMKQELEYARSIRTIPDTHEYYIVQEGDTLWDIANIYRTTWEHLAKINKIKNPDLIYPGQHIKLR